MKYLIGLFLALATLNTSAQSAANFDGPTPLYVYMTVPLVNLYYFQPADTSMVSGGTPGLSAGFGYKYARNKFYTFHAGFSNGNPIRVKRFDSAGRKYNKTVHSYFVSFHDNFIVGPVDIGYGATVSKHQVDINESFRDSLKNITSNIKYYNNWGFGPSVSVYYRMLRVLAGGIIYQPHILSLSNFGFKYEHTIMFDLRISFKRGQRPLGGS